MKRILKEPLVHFLALGVALFVVYGYLNREGPEVDPSTIVVDREKLLTYIQYRSRAFDPQRFNEVLDRLKVEELQGIIDDYVREEALYREAKALRLDKNDYVARLRLIQQLEFITRGFVDSGISVSEAEVQRYFEEHESEYYEQPKVTFTHVFFNQERHGLEQALALAKAELERLNAEAVPFEQAPGHGDRFFYHLNYVQREPEEIAGHFGADMQRALFALKPSDTEWRGPFRSPYGYHLVLLTRNEAGYTPTLAEVRGRVEQDVLRAARDARFEQSIQAIVKAYDVRVQPGIQGKNGA